MNIHEYQAKEILKQYGLPVLKGKSYNKNLETLDADTVSYTHLTLPTIA